MVRWNLQAPAISLCFTSTVTGRRRIPRVPLGMFAYTIPVHRLTLSQGDTLFLYTDGLTARVSRPGMVSSESEVGGAALGWNLMA